MKQDNKDIFITSSPIRLGQFLKLANLVQDGLEAKIRIQGGEVQVNGELETRRGRQLGHGDLIVVDGRAFRLVLDPGGPKKIDMNLSGEDD
jgi:ribosome-associated protein